MYTKKNPTLEKKSGSDPEKQPGSGGLDRIRPKFESRKKGKNPWRVVRRPPPPIIQRINLCTIFSLQFWLHAPNFLLVLPPSQHPRGDRGKRSKY